MPGNRTIHERYELIRQLQTGPLATTHLAEDPESGERVVLKEISVHSTSSTNATEDVFKRLELLEREGKILKHLDHPRIPRFIEAFRTEEHGRVSLWLVQEYREGRNLREAIEDGWHGSAEDVERILREVAEILGHLHARVPPIVHRDVKPANILLEEDGSVCLVDLGAVCTRVLSQQEGSTIIGTPGYVPIEQFAGQAVPASDVYALGMVGVYMVTHEDPLKLTGDDGRVRYRQLTAVDHPTLLDTIDRMTEPMVAKRLANVREVIDSLDGKSKALHGAAAYLDEMKDSSSEIPPELILMGGAEDEEDLAYEMSTDEPEPPTVPAPAVQPPTCSLERDGEEPKSCARHASTLEPIVVGNGVIRTVLDELPEEIDEPELKGWLGEDEAVPLWVVDFTPRGARLVGAIGCPDGSDPVAAAQGAGSDFHLACTDQVESIHHVVLDTKRNRARRAGSFTLDYDDTLEPALGAAQDELDPSSGRPVLAVPDRGPALLIYPAYSTMDDGPLQPRVQPLARGAKSFSLFPASQLDDIGDWQLYEDGGRIFAVVRASSKRDGMHQLHRVRVSSTGSRLVGRFELPGKETGELACHKLTTASTATGLEFRAPNEFGDRQLSTIVTGGRAIPGPSAAPGEANVCADAARVFVRRGSTEVELQLRDSATSYYRIACTGKRCLLAYLSLEGLELIPLELP